MTSPHRCPLCNGTGKIITYEPISTNVGGYEKVCNGCGGSGIIWEPNKNTNVPLWPTWPNPSEPFVPSPPTFVPDNPVVPLTFPKDFVYPEDIQKAGRMSLSKMIKDWLAVLTNEERLELLLSYCGKCGKEEKCDCCKDD